jgi:PIN domain nuclease of toxin-antitoxin system
MATIILDTNAIIQLFGEYPKKFDGMNDVLAAALGNDAFVSPVSAWEIGLLANLPTGRSLGFSRAPVDWLSQLMRRANLHLLPLTIEAAILSSRLPGDFHKDPADRLLVASAIDAGATFVTRDVKILDWATRTGALKVLAC